MATIWSAMRAIPGRAYAPAMVILLVAVAILTNSAASTYSGFIHTHTVAAVSDYQSPSSSHGHSHDDDVETSATRCVCLPTSLEAASLCDGASDATHEHTPQVVLALLYAGIASHSNRRLGWIQNPFVALKPFDLAGLERPPRPA